MRHPVYKIYIAKPKHELETLFSNEFVCFIMKAMHALEYENYAINIKSKYIHYSIHRNCFFVYQFD